jgi:hypothetical protein
MHKYEVAYVLVWSVSLMISVYIITSMYLLHSVHEMNAYWGGGVCLSVRPSVHEFHFLSHLADLTEI